MTEDNRRYYAEGTSPEWINMSRPYENVPATDSWMYAYPQHCGRTPMEDALITRYREDPFDDIAAIRNDGYRSVAQETAGNSGRRSYALSAAEVEFDERDLSVARGEQSTREQSTRASSAPLPGPETLQGVGDWFKLSDELGCHEIGRSQPLVVPKRKKGEVSGGRQGKKRQKRGDDRESSSGKTNRR